MQARAAATAAVERAAEPANTQAAPDLEDPSLYFNRELSWLDFNDRVLQLAEDASVPLLERANFCAIWESNLDEFFMVRVANLHDQLEAGMDARGADGMGPSEQIEELDQAFSRSIFPALTPLAIGLGRPFPYISNLSLSLAVSLRDPDQATEVIARVKVQEELRRRRFGEVVRLEVERTMNPRLREQLRDALKIDERQVYEVDGLLDVSDLWDVVGLPGFSDLRDPPHTPVTPPILRGEDDEEADVFAAIRESDILVHHPYDSFTTSVER